MTDRLPTLARLAGVAVEWTDALGEPHRVSPDTLRRVLDALGHGCGSAAEITASIAALRQPSSLPPMLTADAGCDFCLPVQPHGRKPEVELDLPRGTAQLEARHAAEGWIVRAPIETGYHRLRISTADTVLAVAPARGVSVRELTGKDRAFGVAVQIYGLRRPGDGGIGDFGSVADAARAFAAHGADALAISPTHALFTAEPARASPYAPSSRLLLNPLMADPGCVFDGHRIAAAWAAVDPQGRRSEQERQPLIDWDEAGRAKVAMLRRLFDDLDDDLVGTAKLDEYARAARPEVREHAVFEAIHGHQLGTTGKRHWREWPAALRCPDSPAVAAFAEVNHREVSFHIFLQWLAERSLDDAQAGARAAGMGIGLIADLAVGMDPSGSHAWSRPRDILEGLAVGAPPDILNREGQSWGLTAFSPTGLRASGFEPFLSTLRAAARHAGGVRIDHIMGLRRLWLVPDGASAAEGAYLDYPIDDFLRLLAIESSANGTLVVGEDLGTVPAGFSDALAERGVLGMRVLQFECDEEGQFLPPDAWARDVLAMTSTHDLPPIAGWWVGRDLEWRSRLRGDPHGARPAGTAERRVARGHFWRAARKAGIAEGRMPGVDRPDAAVDAAIAFVAATPSVLAILPMEDLLGAKEGPNLPATVDEHPNWRRRLDDPVPESLAAPEVAARLTTMNRKAPR